ncbi:MAG: MarR family winged helix-turn-helix transcriptional regulator [Steroidobacteraceae bacterium]
MPEQHYHAATYRARDSMGYLLRRVYTTMHERIESAFAGHGFTLMQWIILIYLRDGLARTASDISREFRHDSGALTRVIDRLERRGLLARRRSAADRRAVELSLTPLGRRTVESLLPVVVGQMNLALEPFTREEFVQLRSLMVRLVDHLQALPAPVATAPSAQAPTLRSARATPRRRRAGP